ncbi:polyhydroxyalkanoate biosynthesis repressor PhaR [Neobacillus sp. DY30]|uniref:polyhydroxyalkanoate biosynthesis repressor PhaR n=1 Tax=Neobacillus sp. DY30 TaxID=3047871 RepID=UPI0024C0037B|nr:polyhydroxyalkanoate biosynthesis repressor PhaR [Neobacillus sp. DY30]WHX98546.1 polyhydroxyalkanoate biosynthesis repressor PhaR [Neobacillus sp. DY30]
MSETNPYDSLRQISEMWEKGLNGLLFQTINYNPLIQVTKMGIDANSRYIEMLKRNRELMASYMNLPTKNDVANAVKQTMQAEEKIDILEEQIWNLQDSFTLATQEQNKVLEEILEFTKHIHLEWQKASEELAALSDLKSEFEVMKKLLQQDKKEPVLAAK